MQISKQNMHVEFETLNFGLASVRIGWAEPFGAHHNNDRYGKTGAVRDKSSAATSASAPRDLFASM